MNPSPWGIVVVSSISVVVSIISLIVNIHRSKCRLTQWEKYGDCKPVSGECGHGKQVFHRREISGDCRGELLEKSEDCEVDCECEYSDWEKQGECSHDCDGGDQVYTRKLTSSLEIPRGSTATHCRDTYKTEPCNTQSCCEVSPWEKLGGCAPFPWVESSHYDCPLDYSPIVSPSQCKDAAENLDLKFSGSISSDKWGPGCFVTDSEVYYNSKTDSKGPLGDHIISQSSLCKARDSSGTIRCGNGLQTFTREIVTPGPHCPTSLKKVESCSVDSACCEVDQWINDGECSKDCGGGEQRYLRKVVTPGKECPPLSVTTNCNIQSCGCQVGNWQPSDCTPLPYVKGEGLFCPAGYSPVEDADDCSDAATSIGVSLGGSGGKDWIISDDQWGYGCFEKTFDNRVYFQKDPTSIGEADSSSVNYICKSENPSASLLCGNGVQHYSGEVVNEGDGKCPPLVKADGVCHLSPCAGDLEDEFSCPFFAPHSYSKLDNQGTVPWSELSGKYKLPSTESECRNIALSDKTLGGYEFDHSSKECKLYPEISATTNLVTNPNSYRNYTEVWGEQQCSDQMSGLLKNDVKSILGTSVSGNIGKKFRFKITSPPEVKDFWIKVGPRETVLDVPTRSLTVTKDSSDSDILVFQQSRENYEVVFGEHLGLFAVIMKDSQDIKLVANSMKKSNKFLLHTINQFRKFIYNSDILLVQTNTDIDPSTLLQVTGSLVLKKGNILGVNMKPMKTIKYPPDFMGGKTVKGWTNATGATVVEVEAIEVT